MHIVWMIGVLDANECNAPTNTTPRDISHSKGYSCFSSAMGQYGGVREMVTELTNDLPNLPFMTCFGQRSFNLNEHSGTIPILPKSPGTSSTGEQSTRQEQNQENVDPQPDTPASKSYFFPVQQLRTLLVQ